MRTLLPLLALAAALVAPAALAGHATYVDESRILGCLARVQVAGVGAALNCPGVAKTVAAAEPAGGQYRLTVTWTAAAAEWASLEARLFSCDGACDPPAGVGACVNGVCAGNPGGPAIVQQATLTAGSPLVLTIPTAGAETNVTFTIQAPGPAFASLASQSVHYTLEHVG